MAPFHRGDAGPTRRFPQKMITGSIPPPEQIHPQRGERSNKKRILLCKKRRDSLPNAMYRFSRSGNPLFCRGTCRRDEPCRHQMMVAMWELNFFLEGVPWSKTVTQGATASTWSVCRQSLRRQCHWYLAPLFWAGASSCTPIPPLATTVRLLASSHSDANSHIFHRRVLRRLRPTRSTWVPSGLH